MQTPSSFQYDAFISYSRRDIRFASELEKKLENYSPPKGVRKENQKLKVFRDVQDLKGNRLSESLQAAIRQSRFLIVVCSPHARRSQWVDKEIETFVECHGAESVIPVLVEGAANAEAVGEENEAFPDALIEHLPDPLAVDYRPVENEGRVDRRTRHKESFFQLLAFLLDKEKEELLRRQQLRKRRFVMMGLATVLLVGALIGRLYYTSDENRRNAEEQEQRAETQEMRAESRGLALQASSADPLSTERLLLGVEAFHAAPTTAAISVLRDIMFDYSELYLTLHGHETNDNGYAWVTSAAFSPDGERVVSGGADGTLRVWDARTGTALVEPLLIEKTDRDSWVEIPLVSFSSDGSKILAHSDRGKLHMVSYEEEGDSARLRVEQTIQTGGECIAFSPDRSRMVLCDRDNRVHIWDLELGQQVKEMPSGGEESIYDAALNPDGTLVATGSAAGLVSVWDIDSNELWWEGLHGNPGENVRVHGVAFSPKGNELVSAGSDGAIRIWNVETGEQKGTPMRGHQGDDYAGIKINSVAFSPDGQNVVSSGEDGTVRIWDVESGKQAGKSLQGHTKDLDGDHSVLSAAYSRDGQFIVSGGKDGTVRIWDAVPGEQEHVLYEGRSSVDAVAYSPDGTLIASGGGEGLIRVQHTETGEMLHHHDPANFNSVVGDLAFTPDGKRIISGETSGIMQIWDVESGLPLGDPILMYGKDVDLWDRVFGVDVSPDGQLIAASGSDGAVRLWDLQTGMQRGEPLHGHYGGDEDEPLVRTVRFNPDGSLIASGGRDSGVIVWDVLSGEPAVDPMYGHGVNFADAWERGLVSSYEDVTNYGDLSVYMDASVFSVAFSPDGTQMVSGGIDGALCLWDVETGEQIGEPWRLREDDEERDHIVFSVAYSPDGRWIAAGGNKGIFLWNAETGEQLGKPLVGHTVNSLDFSPDGRYVISGGEDGSVRVWNVDPEVWIERVCKMAGRNFSPSERSIHMGADAPYRVTCIQFLEGEEVWEN